MSMRSTKRSTVMAKPAPAQAPAPEANRNTDPAKVAVAAYFRAQKRGFQPGRELEDWFAAEQEIREQVSHPA